MIDLKPCPFCGSEDVNQHDDYDVVECQKCGTEGPFGDDFFEKWNTRYNEEDAYEKHKVAK